MHEEQQLTTQQKEKNKMSLNLYGNCAQIVPMNKKKAGKTGKVFCELYCQFQDKECIKTGSSEKEKAAISAWLVSWLLAWQKEKNITGNVRKRGGNQNATQFIWQLCLESPMNNNKQKKAWQNWKGLL